MKIKPILILAGAVLFTATVYAQVSVYKSYVDYKTGGGELYDATYHYDMGSGSELFGGFLLTFKSPGQKALVIRTGTVWGFTYKGQLFRTSTPKSIPVALVSKGKICLYENGFAYLKAVAGDSSNSVFNMGSYSYLSKDITGDIIAVEFGYNGREAMKKYRKQNPDLGVVIDCIMKAKHYIRTRDCVMDFNGEKRNDE